MNRIFPLAIICASAIAFANNDAERAKAGYATLDAEIAKVNAAQVATVDSTAVAPADSTVVNEAKADSIEKYETEAAQADSIENDQMAEAGVKQDDSEPVEEAEEDEETAEAEISDSEEQVAEVDSTVADSSASTLDFSNGALPTVNPVRITSPYGIRHYRLHRGVDVKVYKGDSIVAAFPGVVITSQYERRGYGHYLKVMHENGTVTVYGHLSKRLKKVGEHVEAGELIGLGGNTGRSTGSHLHFEIRYGQINIDPTTVFDFENGGLKEAAPSYNVQTASASHSEIQKELSKHRIYKVRRGDTLGSIARKYGTSIRKIKQLNGLRSDRIRAGQILRCS